MDLWSDADAAPASHRQLLLSFAPPAGRTLETFVATGNEVAVRHLERLCTDAGADSRQLYLWGAGSVGKSHLLQAACRAVTAHGGRSAWLPLAALLADGPGVLSDLEALDLVSLDELDAIVQNAAWQRALFDLINEARTSGCRLLMAGRRNPAALELQLKDLPSRLAWGAMYRLAPLDDAGKIKALSRIGERLGCAFAEDALPYLLSNYPRELAALMNTVERLAHAAQERKRRVTVPFIKEILPHRGADYT